MLGAALGWGGLPAEAATYANVVPEKNDGKTPYTLTVTDVPVYGFWSVTLYDDKGWMPVNEYNAYSFNNVTAKKSKDWSITIHFGGDPKAEGRQLPADRTGMELHCQDASAGTGNPERQLDISKCEACRMKGSQAEGRPANKQLQRTVLSRRS